MTKLFATIGFILGILVLFGSVRLSAGTTDAVWTIVALLGSMLSLALCGRMLVYMFPVEHL